MSNFGISRRDFLKLTGAGLLGLFLPQLDLEPAWPNSTRTSKAA